VIRQEVHDGVVVLTLDRPPVNSLSAEEYTGIIDAMSSLADDDAVSAVVVTGAGDRVFCAGQDTREIQAFSRSASTARKRLLVASMSELLAFPKPTVAALNGHAVGAGVMLASVCDTAVAVPGTSLRLTEIDVGVVGGARHALRVLPAPVVRHMALTGSPLSSERAYELGALAALVPPAELLDEALVLARTLSAKEPEAYRTWKQALLSIETLGLQDGWALERRSSLQLEQAWADRRADGGTGR
jgi:enoyl-CoA hydratase